MTEMPNSLTEKPLAARDVGEHDVLSDILTHVRLSGAIFLRGEYSSPWAFYSPEADELIEFLAPGAERLILFHIIREGQVWVSVRGERLDANPGDLVVLPHADKHVMGSPDCGAPVPIADLLPEPPWRGVPVCRFDGGGDSAGVVCGYLKCHDLLFNPFLRRLPPLFRVRPRKAAASELIRACVNYALDESAQMRAGRDALFARLPELLFVEALRLYAEQMAAEAPGWLAALNDPVVSRALALMHAEPAYRWSIGELALRTATSRSVLDERFRRLLGQSPMRYLTEWRLQVASDLLRATPMKVAAVAEQVGYGSEEAFSRAFSRRLGVSPARWREAVSAGGPNAG